MMYTGESSSPDVWASRFSAITWKIFSPFNRDPGLSISRFGKPGWPNCHVIEQKFYNGFDQKHQISVEQAQKPAQFTRLM